MFLLNVNKICLNTISLIRKLRFSVTLKKEHKILNLDDAEDDNLIQASDKDKTIYSIATILKLIYFHIVSRQEEARFTCFKMAPPSLIILRKKE